MQHHLHIAWSTSLHTMLLESINGFQGFLFLIFVIILSTQFVAVRPTSARIMHHKTSKIGNNCTLHNWYTFLF